MNKTIYILFIFILGLYVNSCGPNENDNLVNPPLKSPSIGVRFINLASDGQPRSLMMNSDGKIENIAFGQSSSMINPPADSIALRIFKDAIPEFSLQSVLKLLTRNINYTFVTLSPFKGNSNTKAVDSLTWFNTTSITPAKETDAMIRLFNGVNDSLTTYSARLGCPSGSIIASAKKYGEVMLKPYIIRSGEIPISIIKSKASKDSIVGVYKVKISAQGQYTIMILPILNSNKEEVYILDELGKNSNALVLANPIIEKTADIRIINLSKESFSVKTASEEPIATSLQSNHISNYTTVSACDAQTIDQIIFNSTNKSDTLKASFSVLEKYTAIVIDSSHKSPYKQILAEPYYLDNLLGNNSVVRVVNGVYDHKSTTVSLGSRNTSNGIKKGEPLADKLSFGKISQPVVIPSGKAPISIWTSTEPAKLLFTGLDEFKPGKSYILCILTIEEGKYSATLIEENDYAQKISFVEEGVFVQVAHAADDVDNLNIDFEYDGNNIINDITIPPTGNFATIMPIGSIKITLNGESKTITTKKGERTLIIVGGTKNKIELFTITANPFFGGKGFYARRFINTASDIDNVQITEEKETTDKPATIIADINKNNYSAISHVFLENRKSFWFFNNKKEIYVAGDLSFSYGKAYSILFTGSNKNGYKVLIMQEF